MLIALLLKMLQTAKIMKNKKNKVNSKLQTTVTKTKRNNKQNNNRIKHNNKQINNKTKVKHNKTVAITMSRGIIEPRIAENPKIISNYTKIRLLYRSRI